MSDRVFPGPRSRGMCPHVDLAFRTAAPSDATVIAEIYNHAVSDRNATYDAFPVSGRRFDDYFAGDAKRSLLIATLADIVVGWLSIAPLSTRWAYRYTALGGFFVHRDHRRRGLGTALKAEQILEAARLGYRSLVVEVLATNAASITINLGLGFRIVGEISDAGYRDGCWIGLVIMQKSLATHREVPYVRFAIPTNDLQGSVAFYRDALGLDMACADDHSACFPLGAAAILVEAREEAGDGRLASPRASPAAIEMAYDSEQQWREACAAALAAGATPQSISGSDQHRKFVDMNGVHWALTVRRAVRTGDTAGLPTAPQVTP